MLSFEAYTGFPHQELGILVGLLHALDLWVRRGMPGFPVPFPRILGCDGAGEVLALGEGVQGLEVGQRVGVRVDPAMVQVLKD